MAICKDFNYIFSTAIERWPATVTIDDIIYVGEGRYSTPNLYDICENISLSYIGHDDEIIMRAITDVIYRVLHDVAAYCTKIELPCLRQEVIKEKFENHLKIAVSMDGLGWTDDDRNIVRQYFEFQGIKRD